MDPTALACPLTATTAPYAPPCARLRSRYARCRARAFASGAGTPAPSARTLRATLRGSAHLLCDERRTLCAPRCQFRCGTSALYVHSYSPYLYRILPNV